MSRIAVVGAGLAGLVTARALRRGHQVTVIEKSRGFGGRMATRVSGEFQFDHGAQFFTARTQQFNDFLRPLLEAGVVAIWQGPFAEIEGATIGRHWNWEENPAHYVALPGMNVLGKHLAQSLDVRVETEVTALEDSPSGWQIMTAAGPLENAFDWVVVTAPAAQAARLLPDASPLKALATGRRMSACYALMLGFDDAPDWPWQAARIKGRDISWISKDSSKPGRAPRHTLLVHSTNAWADANLDTPPGDVRAHLLGETSAVLGHDAGRAKQIDLHRWRYANIARQPKPPTQLDEKRRLAVCGDWLVHGRVEGAYTSAIALLAELPTALGA